MNECLAEINELKIRHHTLFWDSKINMYNSVTKQLMAMLIAQLSEISELLAFIMYCISKIQCSPSTPVSFRLFYISYFGMFTNVLMWIIKIGKFEYCILHL